MEQIIIKHPDGSTTPLNSREAVSAVTKAEQRIALLGEDVVAITVNSAKPIDFILGDKIEIYGKTYTLNALPTIKKTGTRKFTYDLTLEGVQYELIDVQFLLPEETTAGDSLTGDLFRFLDILISNANRVFPGKWNLGEYPTETETKTLTFSSGENSLSVLQNLCKEYEQEFEISQENGVRTLNIRKAGSKFPYKFRYGRTGGLYELTRQNVNSKNVVTRLYVYGGSNNLGNKYRYSRLCLPDKIKNKSYIDKPDAIAAFGVKENTKIFEDIYPKRFGEVTALGKDELTFIDNTMNFDLNEDDGKGNTKWLINGVFAKIKFTTGNLAGYEFELQDKIGYNHQTKTFILTRFQDENGTEFPSENNAAFRFSKGDKYFFTDINLPDSYKSDAEKELLTAGEKYYSENSQPQVQYGLNIDQNFIKQFAGNLTVVNLFAAGDYIPVADEEIGVDKEIRIIGFSRDLLKPYKYSLTLGDSVTTSTYNRVISDLNNINKVIKINDLADPAKARRNWRDTQGVLSMVFDPEGDYYSEKIKPLSIETSMLAVGAKSMQFVLQNVVFEPNYEGNPNVLNIIGGQLIHYAIEDAIKIWNIATLSHSHLVSDTAYYIYARCSKTSDAGSIVLDTAVRGVDSEVGFYNFLVGVLNRVQTDSDGKNPSRLVSLTYGSSNIAGRFIKTGRIVSVDGNTYVDLDTGEICGNLKFISNGSKKDVSEIETTAQTAKDYIDQTLPEIISGIQTQLDGQIEQFFEAYNPATNNLPASGWNTAALKEKHLGDLFYNTASGKVWRWVKSGSAYSWQELKNTEVSEALALANDALALSKTKRRVFTATPITPYEVGDLWVQGANGDIMKCKTARATGSYTASDWEKASKYTNDAALTSFINGTYATNINDLTTQIDGKVETWFQTADPSAAWTNADIRAKHVGDMWYSSTTKLLKRYNGTGWTTIEDQKAIDAYNTASTAKDTADGKRRVFVAAPYPPYEVGDLWVQGASGDIMRCKTARLSGSYSASDWDKASKYTDNSALTSFIDGTYSSAISNLTEQIDGKIETWFQTNDPSSSWTNADMRKKHTGDMWYSSSTKQLKRYNGSGWTVIEDQKAIDAYETASMAKDTADGKRRVFVALPSVPYDEGDLWVNAVYPASGNEVGSQYNNVLLRCVTTKTSAQQFAINDWLRVDGRFSAQTSGNIISAEEKKTLRNRFAEIQSTYATLFEVCTSYNIDSVPLKNAYTELSSFLIGVCSITEVNKDTELTAEQQSNYEVVFTNWNDSVVNIQTLISKAESDKSASATRNALAQSIGFANFAEMASNATAGKTIINGGYINTDLLDAKKIIASRIDTIDDNTDTAVEITPLGICVHKVETDSQGKITRTEVTRVDAKNYSSLNVDGLLGTGSSSNQMFCTEGGEMSYKDPDAWVRSGTVLKTIELIPSTNISGQNVSFTLPDLTIFLSQHWNTGVVAFVDSWDGWFDADLRASLKLKIGTTTHLLASKNVRLTSDDIITDSHEPGAEFLWVRSNGEVKYRGSTYTVSNKLVRLYLEFELVDIPNPYQPVGFKYLKEYWTGEITVRFSDRGNASNIVTRKVSINGYSNVSKIFGNGFLFSTSAERYYALLKTANDVIVEYRYNDNAWIRINQEGIQQYDFTTKAWKKLTSGGSGGSTSSGDVIAQGTLYNGALVIGGGGKNVKSAQSAIVSVLNSSNRDDVPNTEAIVNYIEQKISGINSEWYNLRTIYDDLGRLTCIIENYNGKLTDTTKYRMVLERLTKKNYKGLGWRKPWFHYLQTADISKVESGIALTDTNWPITGQRIYWWGKTTPHYFANVFNVAKNSYNKKFLRTYNKKMTFACAIYKYTGENSLGWHRVSNRSIVTLYSCNVSPYGYHVQVGNDF